MSEIILTKLCEYLRDKKTELTKSGGDGRVDSAINEGQIYNDLNSFSLSNDWFRKDNKFSLKKPKSREWYDFAIVCEKDENFFIPVNIKVTNGNKNSDNTNCKLGLYYSLTGVIPKFKNGISWDNYFQVLSNDMNCREDRDYYFLIVNKDDRNDVFFTSLKTMSNLVSSGNNLPFQCDWITNRARVYRTHREATDYILSVFAESLEKRASVLETFYKYFPEYRLEGFKNEK